MLDLQKRLNLTYLFVSHNLSVVKHICDRVTVMYVGKIVETATSQDLFARPRHPYTAALLAALPVADPRIKTGNVELPGEVASPAHPPSGCYFHPRCTYCIDRCKTEAPAYREITPGPLRGVPPRGGTEPGGPGVNEGSGGRDQESGVRRRRSTIVLSSIVFRPSSVSGDTLYDLP